MERGLASMPCARGHSLSIGLHARELATGPRERRAAVVLGPSLAGQAIRA